MVSVYVIKRANNMYYVGKTTKDVNTRFKEHVNGRGCFFTKKYKPEKIVFTLELDSEDMFTHFSENNLVKKYMLEFGINNVRGGSYSTLELSEETIEHLKKDIYSSLDGCFRCGWQNHYANRCYAKVDRFGDRLSDRESYSVESTDDNSDINVEEALELVGKLFSSLSKIWKK